MITVIGSLLPGVSGAFKIRKASCRNAIRGSGVRGQNPTRTEQLDLITAASGVVNLLPFAARKGPVLKTTIAMVDRTQSRYTDLAEDGSPPFARIARGDDVPLLPRPETFPDSPYACGPSSPSAMPVVLSLGVAMHGLNTTPESTPDEATAIWIARSCFGV
jgi:hypothetical protein